MKLEHVRNDPMIQHMRFKNKFTYEIQAEDGVLELASLEADAAAACGKCNLSRHGIHGR